MHADKENAGHDHQLDLELAPKQKRPAGERCCEPAVYPEVERDEAVRLAEVAKALGRRVVLRQAPRFERAVRVA